MVPLSGLSPQRPYPLFWWWSAVGFAGWQAGVLGVSLIRPEQGLSIGCFNLGSAGAELGWPLWEYAWQADFWLFRFVPLALVLMMLLVVARGADRSRPQETAAGLGAMAVTLVYVLYLAAPLPSIVPEVAECTAGLGTLRSMSFGQFAWALWPTGLVLVVGLLGTADPAGATGAVPRRRARVRVRWQRMVGGHERVGAVRR
jgi:hypothetical protein